jgi:hypothetical protein
MTRLEKFMSVALVTFGEYQVGPGCLELVSVVVPYDHLRGILRRDEWLQLKH